MNWLDDAAPEAAKLLKIRSEIETITSQHLALDRAPFSLEETRVLIDNAIERQLDRTPSQWHMFSSRVGEHRLPEINMSVLADLFGRDELVDRITKVAHAKVDQKQTVSSSERAERMSKLEEKIFQLGIKEEDERVRLESEGFEVLPRIGVDPKAVLAAWKRQATKSEAA